MSSKAKTKYRPGLLHFDFSPDLTQVEQAITGLVNDIRDKSHLMLAIEQAGIEDVARRFETETDASGTKWKSWTFDYAKHRPPGKILTLSGALAHEAASPSSFRIGGDQVFFTPPQTSYGALHEVGGGKKKLTQRSFSPFSIEGAGAVATLFAGWMNGNIVSFTNRWGRPQTQMFERTPRGPRFGKRAF